MSGSVWKCLESVTPVTKSVQIFSHPVILDTKSVKIFSHPVTPVIPDTKSVLGLQSFSHPVTPGH